MGILKTIGNIAMKGIMGWAKFVGKHPMLGYTITALPACVLMCNGAMDLAGQGIGKVNDDEPAKEEEK